MKITWVTRSFLDYRIPVYQELNKLCGRNLTVIYYKDIPPERTQKKIKEVLGDKAPEKKNFVLEINPKLIMPQKVILPLEFLLVQDLSNKFLTVSQMY